MTPYYKKGCWNAICDICGFKFKSDELRKNWKGLYVCKEDWEPRHPQDFLRARKESPSISWSRPKPTDIEENVCYLWGKSAYADLAVVDCSQADNVDFTYPFLLSLKNGT